MTAWIDAYWSVVNTVILLAGLAWVARRSRRWSGPGQDIRLRRLETFKESTERRLDLIESWNHRQYDDALETTKRIFDEFKKLHSSVADLSTRVADVQQVKVILADLEQEVQFLKDLGCGYPDCPRTKAVQGDKEG